MTKKNLWIILVVSIVVLLLLAGGYFWYKTRYDGCYEFYKTHRCGLPEDKCTFKNVVFDNNRCD